MIEEQALETLGLSKNEVTVYLYLLRKGLSTGADIYKHNNLDKSATYKALARLIDQNLVYAMGQARNQTFAAYPAQRLQEIVAGKQQELQQVHGHVNDLIADLEQYAKKSYKEKNIKVFTGNDEFELWAKDRLTAPAGSVIRKITSSKLQSSFTPDYDSYTVEAPKQRIARGLHMREIYNQEDLDFHQNFSSITRSDPKLLKEVRKFPAAWNFQIASSFATYDDKVAFLGQKEGSFFGVIIRDELIKKVLDQLFDVVWSQCTVV